MKKTGVTGNISLDVLHFEEIYKDCDDVKKIKMQIAGHRVYLAYLEVAFNSGNLKSTAVGTLLQWLMEQEAMGSELVELLHDNPAGISDYMLYDTVEEAAQAMLTGDAILFIEGVNYAIKIPDRGYPGMGVYQCEEEKVIRGSNEGLSDSVKTNVALVRKRLRSTRVRVKNQVIGVRSHTLVQYMYMEDLVRPELLEELQARFQKYEIDGVLDSGILEQLAEDKWYSPFPQFQTTQRPDRCAHALLEGRIVVLSDNSPVALMLPTDYNSFLKTTDDYYNRWDTATFARILRFFAAFFAMSLPGLYLAVTNFHTQILPTTLLMSFQEAREGVPFPTVFEVILMELSFELLREAGVRLPGAMGSTIGIVGGLIIGQAAVEANLVSPIVVILVSFTALCSFAIPNEEFAYAFRVLKFVVIAMSAWFGFFGFMVALCGVQLHLARLKSFGVPYLMPYVAADVNHYEDEKDFVWRGPIKALRYRPIYTRVGRRRRLRKREN